MANFATAIALNVFQKYLYSLRDSTSRISNYFYSGTKLGNSEVIGNQTALREKCPYLKIDYL